MFDSYTCNWIDLSFITASCVLVAALFHRKRQNKKNEHENRYVQELHRLDAHSPLQGFISLQDSRNFVMQPKCSPFVRFLDMKNSWTFKLCDTFSDAVNCLRGQTSDIPGTKKNFYKTSVPSQWQFFNVGDMPTYRCVSHLQEYNDILKDDKNPSGYYCHNFHVPRQWDTRQIRLLFGGVDCAMYLWVNGIFIGFSKDSRLPAEFDITESALFGEKNCAEVIVVKYSDAMLLENYTTWRLNGIFREVQMISLPRPVCISDYSYNIKDVTNNSNEIGGRYLFTAKMKLSWDLTNPDYHFGQESAGVYPRQNFVATSAEWILSSYLYFEGVMVSSTVGTAGSFESSPHYFGFNESIPKPISKVQEYVYLPSGVENSFPGRKSHVHNIQHARDASTVEDEESDSNFLSTPLVTSGNKITASLLQAHEIKAPKFWSAEQPNVYTLVMSLRNTTDGSVVQSESCRVTFRSVDVNYGLLRINAKPIMIRGTNLHEHDPYKGCSVSQRVVEYDIQLMKRSNINAIRTVNYPHSPWLYELCTLYGLYVVDEANICTNVGVGAGDGNVNVLADDPDWEKAYMVRMVRMYERDKVHGSIIAWSLGNNSGYGRVHDKMANWIGDRDPSRLVMYEPASYGPRATGSPHTSKTTGTKVMSVMKTNHKRTNVQMATDILCPKYARVSECIVLGNRYPDLPLILMEYSDMRGNSGGNLMDYWAAFNNYTRLQGGFIHSWCDQGISTANSKNDSYWGGFGNFGGEIFQTTTDPAYSWWGNNPPGQASPIGLYTETSLLELAQRNSIKGRVNDEKYTPFTNGVRQGGTPYPYIRYGMKKSGVAANSLTPGGLTWPDRGIQDKSVFEVQNPLVRTTHTSPLTTKSDAEIDKVSSSRYSNMYGLCPPPVFHKSFYKLLFTSHLSDDRIVLSQAVAKPQLLEAKYCMTPFDCFVETVHVHEKTVEQCVKKQYNHETHCYEPIPQDIPPDCNLFELQVSVKMNIISLLDHVEDISKELSFDSLLLCNGIIVCTSSLDAKASAVVHHTFQEESGRPTFQELEALGDFSVTLLSTQNARSSKKINDQNHSKTVCGIKCPEDILLVPYSRDDIDSLIQNANAEYKATILTEYENVAKDKAQRESCVMKSTRSHRRCLSEIFRRGVGDEHLQTAVYDSGCQWSVVVLARTLKDSAWAPAAYPLGVKQCKISNNYFLESKFGVENAPTARDDIDVKSPSNRPAPLLRRRSLNLTPTKKKLLNINSANAASVTSVVPVAHHTSIAHQQSEISSSFYNISVLWADSKSRGVCVSEDRSSDVDILLRANATASVDVNTQSHASDADLVEVKISGKTGCLVSYVVDGVDLLHGDLSSQEPPSEFQLHRAPTTVDRGGYLAAWQALGLDSGLEMQPLTTESLRSEISSGPSANDKIVGSTKLKFVHVDHVFMHPPSPVGDKSREDKGNGGIVPKKGIGQGVQCKWEMAPAALDKGRVLLLLQIQKFVNDSRVRSTLIEVRSNGQETFVHEIAKCFRLGRATVSPYSEKDHDSVKLHEPSEQDRSIGMAAKLYLEYVKVRLWKVAFFPSSTIPYVDTLAVGPFGGLKYDEVDLEDDIIDSDLSEVLTNSNGNSDVFSKAYFDSFDDNSVSESLSQPSHTSNSIRKNEKNFVLDKNVDDKKGNGSSGSEKPSSLRKLFSVKYCVVYLLDEHATLLVHAQVDVSALPCPVPRIGLKLKVDPEIFSHASWLGYGPHENYPDRKFSSIMAVHGSHLDALSVPYMIPQENGARGGLEWLKLLKKCDANDRDRRSSNSSSFSRASPSPSHSIKSTKVAGSLGSDVVCDEKPTSNNEGDEIGTHGSLRGLPLRELVVRCSRPFSFSAHPYSTDQMRKASNTADLLKYSRESSSFHLNIDPYLMGIGGDDTWSACVHDKHIIHPAKYDFQLAFSAKKSN